MVCYGGLGDVVTMVCSLWYSVVWFVVWCEMMGSLREGVLCFLTFKN